MYILIDQRPRLMLPLGDNNPVDLVTQCAQLLTKMHEQCQPSQSAYFLVKFNGY